MKKTNLFILFLGVVFLLAGVQGAMGASRATMKPRIQKPTPPDLRVTVIFADIVSYKNSKGIMCYSPRPIFTIKNYGQATAKGFDYTIEWKLNPTHVWQVYSGGQNVNLLGGATKTINFNSPVADQYWCVNETNWKPGWRIKADINNDVSESNENNNVAEKIYTHKVMTPIAPPKTINRKFQKIPTPR